MEECLTIDPNNLTEQLGSVKYNIDENLMKNLVKRMSEEYAFTLGVQACVMVRGDSPYSSLGRDFEHRVFQKSFNNDEVCMRQEYAPYEKHSKFFLSIDTASYELQGVLRIIENSDSGLKTLNDIRNLVSYEDVAAYHDIRDFNDCWDIATIAIPSEYHHKFIVSLQLYRAMYLSAYRSGIKHLVAAIDEKPYKGMIRMGMPFEPLVGMPPVSYLGSEKTQFVYGKVENFGKKIEEAKSLARGHGVMDALISNKYDSFIYLS